MSHLSPDIRDEWKNTFDKYLLSQCIKKECIYTQKIQEQLEDLKNIAIKSTGNLDATGASSFKKREFYYNGIFSSEADIFFDELVKTLTICYDQCSVFAKLKAFLAFQLLFIATNKSNIEYLIPLFNRILSVLADLENVVEVRDTSEVKKFYKSVNIISLLKCNLTIKRIIPMILAKMIYNMQKSAVANTGSIESTTHLIIDEAHNILGSIKNNNDYWQDRRLSAFEEIVKEGRKFGFFLTIASQRPADISPTIMSQLHNFFVHRLVNDKDLTMVENTMPTLDKTAFDMIPSLGQGEAVLTGKAFPISIFTKIDHAAKDFRPKSDDVILTNIWNGIE